MKKLLILFIVLCFVICLVTLARGEELNFSGKQYLENLLDLPEFPKFPSSVEYFEGLNGSDSAITDDLSFFERVRVFFSDIWAVFRYIFLVIGYPLEILAWLMKVIIIIFGGTVSA